MIEDDRFTDAGRKGGEARAAALTDEERSGIARKAAQVRWAKPEAVEEETVEAGHIDEEIEADPTMPVARWRGTLNIVGMEVPCYVLDNGARVIGRTSAAEVLSGIKGGGALEIYLRPKALEPFINKDLVLERFVAVSTTGSRGFEDCGQGTSCGVVYRNLSGVRRWPASVIRSQVASSEDDRPSAADGHSGKHVSIGLREVGFGSSD